MIPEALKSLLYRSGLLDVVHRLRNRRTLTAVMFHRVLAPVDPRWKTCDPDYTIGASDFDGCLAFFERHYNLVSLRQVIAARTRSVELPPRALLVTFDDGWADNFEYALPMMRRRGVPGAIFVVADAVGRSAAFFQEQLVAGWRSGRMTALHLAEALRVHSPNQWVPADNNFSSIRRLIRAVEALNPPAREQLICSLSAALSDTHRQMVSRAELVELDAAGITVGVHGKTHLPMTSVTNLDAELGGAREQLSAMLGTLGGPVSMSFPHGKFDGPIASRARDSGFEVAFTSVPCINDSLPTPSWLLGRLGFSARAMQDENGALAPHKLAMYLFFRARRRLD